jgi:hypothetical protein
MNGLGMPAGRGRPRGPGGPLTIEGEQSMEAGGGGTKAGVGSFLSSLHDLLGDPHVRLFLGFACLFGFGFGTIEVSSGRALPGDHFWKTKGCPLESCLSVQQRSA